MASIEQLNNLQFFRDTVNALSYSQGFYGRLKHNLDNAEVDQLDQLAEELPIFKDTIDIVFFCEQ